MRKYIFKTESEDQRPIKHSTSWAIIGAGVSKKPYWLMVLWLNGKDDVFDYYPEAYDVSVILDADLEIKRGGKNHIVIAYKTLGFVDGIKYCDSEVNPTLLAIIEKMAYDGHSESTMAKRAGINFNKFKKICGHPMVKRAIDGGRNKFLEDLSKSI